MNNTHHYFRRTTLGFNSIGNYNTAIGTGALEYNVDGGYNTAVGASALLSNTANDNTAVGTSALEADFDGGNNTAVGTQALEFNTVSNNTAVGYQAMENNLTGSSDTAVGTEALLNNESGSGNTAIGLTALLTDFSACCNTAVGYQALLNDTATDNTAIGYNALATTQTGTENTAIGDSALYDNDSGDENIAIGAFAGENIVDSNNIDIGNLGSSGDSGTIRIGIESTQEHTYIAGIYGVTSSSGVEVYVNANGQLGTTTSSRKFKDDIHDMGGDSQVLMSLRPVSFRYKPEIDPEGLQQYGLIAEEVAEKAPQLVAYKNDGTPYSVRYNLVNAMMLNEVQRLHHENESQQSTIATLQAQRQQDAAAIAALAARLDAVERQLH